MHKFSYEEVGVGRTEDGGYEFRPGPSWIPDYVASMGEKIHICQNEKLNAIGEERTALSKNWYLRQKNGIDRLRKNVANFFNNVHRDAPAGSRLWSTYKDFIGQVRGKGYATRHISVNCRATNAYRDRSVLAYTVNLFLNVDYKRFMNSLGVEPDDDLYALSTMIQWIWRSAIRDGGEIWVYVPSKRMRELLEAWIAETTKDARERAGEETVVNP